MSVLLARLVLALKDNAQDWYILADAFRDEGRESDARMIDIDGLCQSLIDEAKSTVGDESCSLWLMITQR